MKPSYSDQAPELMRDMTDKIKATLRKHSQLDEAAISEITEVIVERMAADWGGQNIYFPMWLACARSKISRQIYQEFTGHNQAELGRRYGYSVQHIYRIIRAVQEDERRRRQGDLFGE